MQEIWKDIKGFEGIFQISNKGRVRRILKNGNIKILNGGINNKGYCYVRLSVKNKKHPALIHRLVAQAFCEKIVGCDIVNHLDNNPLNNIFSNLEWTTPKGNIQHALKQGRLKSKETILKAVEARKRSVIATKGNTILYFSSMTEAEKIGFDHRHISDCCKGKRNFHRGFAWKYADNPELLGGAE